MNTPSKRILLLGSGGREHAFSRSLALSPRCEALFIAPGNAGTAQYGTNVPLRADDFMGLKDLVLRERIDLVVVGPEDPLVKGVVDFFQEDDQLRQIPVIGPSRSGARLEGSKEFSKAFMQRHDIPTAAYQSFTSEQLGEADAFLDSLRPPYVIKADGLAAGKGVLILDSLDEAREGVRSMLQDKKFGAAGERVVIEEFLHGIELSVFVLTDGKNYLILPEAKDYKRIGEGDTGLNTGGMGAVSPVPFADDVFMQKVEDRIVKPTVNGLAAEGIPYIGFIFIGLMSVEGEPYVIEYNCRMGDPETEVVLPRIRTDFVDLMDAVAHQKLNEMSLDVDPRTATTVIMVSGGYPGNYDQGFALRNLENAGEALVFHAGTRFEGSSVVTAGGRVLALTGLGSSIPEALNVSYAAALAIDFDYAYYRRDIGQDLIRLTEKSIS
ncbi:MAG: phosphoribosylamine--glycine ligase [Bacteroidota bacterium]